VSEEVKNMKKILLLIFSAFLLGGCGSDELQTGNEDFSISDYALKERDELIESYNEIISNSENNDDYIEISNIREPNLNEEGHYIQTLLNGDGKSISVTYSSDGELIGYSTNEITEEELPINVSFVVASALDLDIGAYGEAYTQTVSTDEILNSESYQDNGYEVFLMYSEFDDNRMVSMTIDKVN
jgi:roadblock/LC7 domain-containing protein